MVKVRWWHRLILVLIAFGALVLAGISLFIAYESSKEAVYSYSWRGDLAPGAGSTCTVSIYSSIGDASVYCGEFHSPTTLLDDLAAHGLIERAQIPVPRTSLSDGITLSEYAKSAALAYTVVHQFRAQKAWKPVGIALAVIIGYLFLAGFLFNVVLWIAHGDWHLEP